MADLSQWAKIIDYWIIGVDVLNTDDSEEVIHAALKGIPGEIVKVHSHNDENVTL